MEVFESLFTMNFFLVAGGVYVIFVSFKKALPRVYSNNVFKRFMPLLTVALGAAVMALIPDMSELGSFGGKILHGIMSGWVAQHFHKIVSLTVLGRGLPGAAEGTTVGIEAAPLVTPASSEVVKEEN